MTALASRRLLCSTFSWSSLARPRQTHCPLMASLSGTLYSAESSLLLGSFGPESRPHILGKCRPSAPETLTSGRCKPPPQQQKATSAPYLAVRAMGSRKKSGFAQLLSGRSTRPVLKPKTPLAQGVVSPMRLVPPGIQRPPYADSGVAPEWDDAYQIQDEEGVQRMRAAGKLAAQVRDAAGKLVKPGVTTEEIDVFVHDMIVAAGAYPSPLNYGRFPKSVCTSVNECVCHGIPDSRPLQDGDIVNIDVTVFLDGYHGDTSKTFLCGSVSPQARKLVKVTEESLLAAISICRPGAEIKQIGATIHAIADKHEYGVVKQFVGHGVGRMFHSGPAVVHCRNNTPGRMRLGQTFTIEPMLTAGGVEVELWEDDWTAVTEDGCLSAQFEHTLLITQDGADILTL